MKQATVKRKLTHDFKMSDIFKHYTDNLEDLEKRNGYELIPKTFNNILTDINNLVTSAIVEDNTIFTIPKRIGEVYIVKKIPKISFDDNGRLKTRGLIVDWNLTKKMWEENPELKEQEKKYYFTDPLYIIYYDKFLGRCKNKSIYGFVATDSFKDKITEFVNNPLKTITYHERDFYTKCPPKTT